MTNSEYTVPAERAMAVAPPESQGAPADRWKSDVLDAASRVGGLYVPVVLLSLREFEQVGRGAATVAYGRTPGGDVIPLHQSAEGTTHCLYCGGAQPWQPMERCPGSGR